MNNLNSIGEEPVKEHNFQWCLAADAVILTLNQGQWHWHECIKLNEGHRNAKLKRPHFIIINPLTARVVGAPQMICNQFSPLFPVLHCPLGLAELQACPFPDVVFPHLPLSTLSSSPFHCALQDGFGQTWWTGDMTIPLQFASLYDGQEIFVWSNCLLDLDIDFLVGNMVFVW